MAPTIKKPNVLGTGTGSLSPDTSSGISASATPKEANIGGQSPAQSFSNPDVPTLSQGQTVARTSAGKVGNADTSFTGTVSSQGAYNPYTGGTETKNAQVGVNTGIYSPENKQSMWEQAGKTGTFNPDSFYRGTDGSLQMKNDRVFKNQGTDTTTAPSAPTQAYKYPTPDDSKPHMTGDIWNPETGSWELPGTSKFSMQKTGQDESSSFDYSKLTPEQKAIFDKLPSEYQQYYKAQWNYYNNLGDKAKVEAQLAEDDRNAKQLNEQIYAKNVGQAQTDAQADYEANKKAMKIQADAELQSAKDKMQKTVDNANYFKGAQGFAQTQQAIAAQTQQIDRASRLVQDISSLNDIKLAGLDRDISKQMRELQEALDANVSRATQEMKHNAGVLVQMGKLDSLESINKFRQDARNTLNTQYNDFVNKTFAQSKFVLDQAEKRLEEYKKTQKFDSNLTQQVNDGYVYNAAGQRMTDASGQPIRGTQSKPIEQSIDNKDGTYSILYKDGTFEKIKAGMDVSRIPDKSITEIMGPSTGYVYNASGAIVTDPQTGLPVKYVPEAGNSQIVKDDDGNMYVFDPKSKTLEQYTGNGGAQAGGASQPVITSPDEVADFSMKRRGRENLQCGELSNDYWLQKTGKPAGMGDTLESKVNAVKSIGVSNAPVVGGLFVSNPLNNDVGHTGIVESVNQDGSITVMEANRGGKKDGEQPVLTTYKNADGMLFSVAPTAPSKYTEVAQQIIDGSIKPTDLKNLGYKNSEIDRIESERNRLSQSQIESEPEVVPAMIPLYRAYAEDGKIPSAQQLKSFGMSADQFTAIADDGYRAFLDQKAKDISSKNPTLSLTYDLSQYSANSPTQREELNKSITKIGDIDKRMVRLIQLFKDSGTEIFPTEAKREMETLREQIILKAKEVENLGVLNGPDLGILEKIMPETNTVFSFNDNTLKKFESIRDNYRSDAQSKAINYGAKLEFKDDQPEEGFGIRTTPSGKQVDINQF